MAKRGIKDPYSLSEVARELGVSRQCVHQKVTKCQNPYVKGKRGPKKSRMPVAPVKTREEIIVKISFYVVCPFCMMSLGLHDKPANNRLKHCMFCKKYFRLGMETEEC